MVNQRNIHFEVIYPTHWGCLRCQKVVRDNVASVRVYIGGSGYMLGADEDGACPICKEIKAGKTPALFDTPELANAHVEMLVEKFREGNTNFEIKVLNFGILAAGSNSAN